MLSACLFLGFKVAQMNVNIDLMKSICPFLKEKHTEKNIENILIMLDYEFFLINVLNYEFYVFCPYKAMLGFIYQMKKNQVKHNLNVLDDGKEFENQCEMLIDQTFLSDIMFVLSYSYIALSCIFITSENFKINTETLKGLLEIEDSKFNKFYTEVLPLAKEYLTNTKIISDEDFVNNKKKILKFLHKNPKYTEKIEKDREGVKIRMKEFSGMFEDNLVDSQVKTDKKIIQNTLPNEKNIELIHNKRERDGN